MKVPFSLVALTGSLLLLPSLQPSSAAGNAPIEVEGGSRTTVDYDCSGKAKRVVYVNGPDDALALLDVAGKRLIFVNVISGSGARYASGSYVWWSKGPQARLYDEMRGPNAKALLECRQRR